MFTIFLMIAFGFIWLLTFTYITDNGWVILVGFICSLVAGLFLGKYLKRHRALNENSESTKLHYVTSVIFIVVGIIVTLLLVASLYYLMNNYYPFREMDALMGIIFLPIIVIGLFGSGSLFLSGLSGVQKAKKEKKNI